ncbi:MAG: LysR family transcriptional regulator [Gluconacetobacter diazotrophicus]|nr:LysR family transcriptional regulator [Gluconacetobacter diazotrophicus]
MELRRLECFVAVAELLSFRRAAERLHLSPPPLTRQIAALEREVGVRLLERERRRTVALTDAGHAFLTHARKALQSAEAAAHHARQAARGAEGRLVIAGCATLAAPMLAAHLKTFRQTSPGVEVSFVEATHAQELAALREGRAHLAISANFGSPPDPLLRSRDLCPIVLVAVTAGDNARAGRPRAALPLEVLNGETLLCPAAAHTPSYQEFLQALQRRTGFAPEGIRPVDGVENILHMVAAGYGVAILPAKLVKDPPPNCRTRRLRLPAPGYRLRMVWPRESRSAVLRDFLRVVDRAAWSPDEPKTGTRAS